MRAQVRPALLARNTILLKGEANILYLSVRDSRTDELKDGHEDVRYNITRRPTRSGTEYHRSDLVAVEFSNQIFKPAVPSNSSDIWMKDCSHLKLDQWLSFRQNLSKCDRAHDFGAEAKWQQD